MTPTCGEVDGRTRCLALSVASAVSGTIAGLPSGFASTAASAEHGIQKTSEGRREWSYCGLSSILHVLGHATTDMRFRRDRADCGDHGLRSSPDTGQRLDGIKFSGPVATRRARHVDCRPAGAAGTIGAVPFRVAVTRRARRNTLFMCSRRTKRRTTQRKQNASTMHVRSQRATGARARSPGHVPAHVSISRRSQFHARDSRDRRAGSRLERRDPPPGRGRGRCAVPPDHTPRRAPRPRRSDREPGSAGVPLCRVKNVPTFVPPPVTVSCSVRICSIFSIASILTLAERIQPSATHGPSLPVPKELTHT